MKIEAYYPSLATVQELSEQGYSTPIWRELPADLETPVSVYLKLRGKGSSFLLESVEKGEQLGRYSFLGIEPTGVLTAQDGKVSLWEEGSTGLQEYAEGDPLAAAEKILSRFRSVAVNGLPRFYGGLVGYLAYDAVRFFEKVAPAPGPGLELPDAILLQADSLVVFDHVKHRLLVVANTDTRKNPKAAYESAAAKIDSIVARLRQPLHTDFMPAIGQGDPGRAWVSDFEQDSFENAVREAKEFIAAGDIFQVVLSQRLSRQTTADPFTIYRALRMLNPSPYMFCLDLPGDLSLIGSSPEMLVRLEDGRAEVRPIAGTRPRGKDPIEDEALAEELLNDPKERAEHVMLVDLGRNDLGRVCTYGSVKVPEMMGVERYSHVMHIVSGVRGELAPGLNAFDLTRATFPAGTVSGAPKVRAMEIIAALEGKRRGPYAGSVGYFGYSGNMDTCIAIRTIVMQGDVAHVQAGAGIVADSDPTREYEETLNKAQALADAVDMAESKVWRGEMGE
jgi:anthranilate synthase component 1